MTQRLRTELILSSLAINTLMLTMPIVTLQVYDRVLTHQARGTMTMLILGAVAAVVIDTVLRVARTYISTQAAQGFEHGRACRMMRRVVHAWPADEGNRGVGMYVQGLSAIGRIKDYAGMRLITLGVDLPYLLLFMVLLAYIGGTLIIAPLTLMVAFGMFVWQAGQRLLKAIDARDTADSARYGMMLEALSGIHSIKAMGIEPHFTGQFNALQMHAGRINFRVARLNYLLANFGSLFAQAVVIVVVASGAPMVIRGQLTMGALIACVLLSGRLIQPLQHALALWISYQEYCQAQQRLALVEALPIQRTEAMTAPPPKSSGTIECSELGYGLGGDRPLLLSGVNLRLAQGETLALRGGSGEGISTLFRLIAGVIEPTRGRVLVDGLDPVKLDGAALLHRVGYLPPDAVLYRGSILDNITGFNPYFKPAAEEIAELLGMAPLVARLPFGYDTPLDGGPTESIAPGFCQRIAMARALLHKPKIILYEHADRSLDRDGYNHLFRLIARIKGKATVLVASDDQNLLRLCDGSITLERGTVIDQQTPKPRAWRATGAV